MLAPRLATHDCYTDSGNASQTHINRGYKLCLMERSYHAMGHATRTHARNKNSTKPDTLHIGPHWQTYIGERGGLGQKTPMLDKLHST